MGWVVVIWDGMMAWDGRRARVSCGVCGPKGYMHVDDGLLSGRRVGR